MYGRGVCATRFGDIAAGEGGSEIKFLTGGKERRQLEIRDERLGKRSGERAIRSENGASEKRHYRDAVSSECGDKGLQCRERQRGRGAVRRERSDVPQDRPLDGGAVLLRGYLVVRAGGGI